MMNHDDTSHFTTWFFTHATFGQPGACQLASRPEARHSERPSANETPWEIPIRRLVGLNGTSAINGYKWEFLD